MSQCVRSFKNFQRQSEKDKSASIFKQRLSGRKLGNTRIARMRQQCLEKSQRARSETRMGPVWFPLRTKDLNLLNWQRSQTRLYDLCRDKNSDWVGRKDKQKCQNLLKVVLVRRTGRCTGWVHFQVSIRSETRMGQKDDFLFAQKT